MKMVGFCWDHVQIMYLLLWGSQQPCPDTLKEFRPKGG